MKRKPMTVAEAGRKGGLAWAAKLTKAQRSAAGRKASLARWAKERLRKWADGEGEL